MIDIKAENFIITEFNSIFIANNTEGKIIELKTDIVPVSLSRLAEVSDLRMTAEVW